MKKREFKKMLKKEKNPILKGRRPFWIVLVFLMIVIIFANVKWKNNNNEKVVQHEVAVFQIVILVCSVLSGCIIDLLTDIKIAKMYKLYKNGKEYSNTQKPFKTSVIICLLIISMFFAIEYADFLITVKGNNKPIIAVRDSIVNNKYKSKYKSLLYDYYVGNDNIVYLNKKNSKFENFYAQRVATTDYIDKFNKCLKELGIDVELDYYDYTYMDGFFIWDLEDGLQLKIQIEGDNIRDPEKENVVESSIVSYKGNKERFERYSKVLIKTNYDYYTNVEIDEVYSKTNYEDIFESEGVGYQFYKFDNVDVFYATLFLENSSKSTDYYLHTAIDNSIYLKLPNSYVGKENKEDGYAINCIEEETQTQIIAKFYTKDYEDTFYLTVDDAINKMEEECSKKYTDIKKTSESNTVEVNGKEISEREYVAKNNDKQINYKISGFNMGNSREYIITTCEIMNSDLYDTKISELDNIRNSIQIFSNQIAVDYKVKNDEAVYEKKNIDNILKINIPKSFAELNDETKNKIYLNSVPEMAYANSDYTVSIAVKINDIPEGENYSIEDLTDQLSYEIYKNGSFLGSDVKNVKGNKIGWVKAIVKNENNTETYNHIMLCITNGKYIIVNLSARRDLISKWNWVGDEILESIEF